MSIILPPVTGFDAGSTTGAYDHAVQQINAVFGGCPPGLVQYPATGAGGSLPSNSVYSTGWYSGVDYLYYHALKPSGINLDFKVSGCTYNDVNIEWDELRETLDFGKASCPICVDFTNEGENFSWSGNDICENSNHPQNQPASHQGDWA